MRRHLSILLFIFVCVAFISLVVTSYGLEISDAEEPTDVVTDYGDDSSSDVFGDGEEGVGSDREQGWKQPILAIKGLWKSPKDNKYYTTSRRKLWIQALDRNEKDKKFSTKDPKVAKIVIKVTPKDNKGCTSDCLSKEYFGNRTGKFSLEKEGVYNISFTSTDILGNTEKERNVEVTVDNTPPTVSTDYEVLHKNGSWVTKDNVVYVPCKHRVLCFASDTASGVSFKSKKAEGDEDEESVDEELPGQFYARDTYAERIDKKSFEENGIYVSIDNKKFALYNAKKGIVNLKPGWHVLKIKAVDNVGNESAPLVSNVFVDDKRPVIRIKPKYDLVRFVTIKSGYYYDSLKTGKVGEDGEAVDGDDDTDGGDVEDVETDGESDAENAITRPGLFLVEDCVGCDELNGKGSGDETEDEEEGDTSKNLYAAVDNEYSVVAYDLQSGISDIFIKVDQANKPWDPYRRPIRFSTSGKHTIYVKAYDKVGNFRQARLSLVVDNYPPDAESGELEAESIAVIESEHDKDRTCGGDNSDASDDDEGGDDIFN